MTTKWEYKIIEANEDWPLPNSKKEKIENAKREIFKHEKKKKKKTWPVGQPDQIFIYYIKVEVQLEFKSNSN